MKNRKDLFEIGASLVKQHSVEICLAENLKRIQCKGRIIDSHTIPKSGSLKQIAKDGHVYTYMTTDFIVLDENKGKLVPQLIGIGKASTFKGFCSEHDRELFSSVEIKKFEASPEQCFALFFRAYAKEVYNKKIQYNDVKIDSIVVKKFKTDEEKNNAYEILEAYRYGLSLAIKDINFVKPRMDKILQEQNYSSLKALIVEFKDPLPFMVSGAIYPEQDFNGELLQQLGTNNFSSMALLGCTSFSIDNKGFFVFSWLDSNEEIVDKFINSFLKIQDRYKFNHLIKMVFYFFENVYMSPIWWESLSKENRDYLNRIMNSGMLPNNPRPRNYLKYDGYRLPDIKIVNIKKINF